MKNIGLLVTAIIVFFSSSLVAFAHSTEEVHEEVPASIDAMAAVFVIAAIAIGGFLLWKYVLKK